MTDVLFLACGRILRWRGERRLFEFDDLSHHVLALRALERALVVIRLVRLNASEPHLCTALGALGMRNFLRTRNEFRCTHANPPLMVSKMVRRGRPSSVKELWMTSS